jgi:oxaloacetate decarboxylase alpha subunit
VGEITVEEEGMRVTVRRTADAAAGTLATPAAPAEPGELPPVTLPSTNGLIFVESPMVGVFYRSPEPGSAPFVEVGDTVAPGQTLCLLEAMKLFNELKADSPGIVRAIHADNAQPVEFGQLLFELEPVVVPLDAL